jgi:hypothetical protein
MRKTFLSIFLATSLLADSADELLEGFDDTPKIQKTDESDDLLAGFDDKKTEEKTTKSENIFQKYGIEGKFTQSIAYSYHNDKPHDGLSSLKSSLFLEYNHALWDSFKLKINGNAFYDTSYLLKGRDKFSNEDISALESEAELFDFFIQGSLSDKLDIKAGRQVVVWGKSDTIRITDVLNPLDNRLPAMVDIEDLRLPETMVKFDYYRGNWRVSSIVIVEQRFNKNPPYRGDFNPSKKKIPTQNKPDKPSFALNAAGEFKGFDVDFYLADIYAQDELGLPLVNHQEKMQMAGAALNYVYGSWLIKGEFAYKKDFRFLQSKNETFARIESLIGVEYNGIADTKLSYDIANKHMREKSDLFEQDTYQHAFRATSDFLNATLHANYLISLFGKKLDKGGFQRAWIKYDLADGISANFGVVDYIGGTAIFDAIENNDIIFADMVYSF